MARCLIIGCGCRGRALAGELRGRGHAVRGTTRRADQLVEIEAVGAEAVVGDPDRVATLIPALERVTLVYLLLGSAVAEEAEWLSLLHGSRLEMLLTRMLDSTVRGIVYEAAGSVDARILVRGAQLVRAACERSRIPYTILGVDPGDHVAWLAAALAAAAQTIGGEHGDSATALYTPSKYVKGDRIERDCRG